MNCEGEIPPLVKGELDRLCDNGNPLAIRFQSRLSEMLHPERAPDEPAKPPPGRIEGTRGLKWGVPKK